MKSCKAVFFFLILGVFLGSCVKDDDGSDDNNSGVSPKVILTFDPMVGGNEIQIAERFINPQGYPVETLQLKFYISNITLLDGLGGVPLSEIEIIDIRENLRTVEFEVPEGDYYGIKFDLGVPVHLNGTDNPDFSTSMFEAGHPLNVSNGMYWGWAGGYRFFSFEGRCDTVPNTGESLPIAVAFHTGRDTLFRSVPDFARNISMENGDMELFHFGIEMDKYFVNETDTIDLKVDRSFHGSPDQLILGTKLANNSAATFHLIN